MSVWRMTVVLTGLLFAWSLRGEAAELKGFGHIEFGMTKAEAIAALGGQTISEEEDHLTYWYVIGGDLPASGADGILKVTQYFVDGRAAEVILQYDSASANESPQICAASTDHFVSMLIITYGKDPVVQEFSPFHMLRNYRINGAKTVLYKFPFEYSAFIQIESQIIPGGRCAITFWYHPPEANPIPF